MSALGVLFDLDGTLVDTAPDLVAVLNQLLHERGCVRMPFAIARNEVSNGATGLLRLGFGERASLEDLDGLRARFLEVYARSVCVGSRLFMDIDSLFRLDGEFRWGIVTNKPQAFTEPLLAKLGIAGRWSTIVSGDRLPERKPHPAPLLLAARELGLPPSHCVYLGDAPRDVEAGRAAGMKTVAAAFGYIRPREDPTAWGADFVVRQPHEIPAVLSQLRRSAAA